MMLIHVSSNTFVTLNDISIFILENITLFDTAMETPTINDQTTQLTGQMNDVGRNSNMIPLLTHISVALSEGI